MTDPSQAATVLLKLYELRTEPALRQARAWFAFEFHPTSARDVLSTWLGPGHESAPYRMVTSYWDMAAALVNHGAIDETLFNEANGEHIFIYMKMQPVIEDLRKMFDNPDFLKNLETLIKRIPNIDEKIAGMRERMAQFASAIEQRRKAAATA